MRKDITGKIAPSKNPSMLFVLFYGNTAIAAILAVSIALLLTGCNSSNTGNDRQDITEGQEAYIYTAQYVLLPKMEYQTLVACGDKLIFSASINEQSAMGAYGLNQVSTLYSMNHDGTDITQLINYEHPEVIPSDAFGNLYINNMCIDSNGDIWVCENWYFYGHDFDAGNTADSGAIIRKLDTTGAELFRINLSGIAEQYEQFHIICFGIDYSGNIYIAVDGPAKDGWATCIIYVLDNTGDLKFTLNRERWIGSFVCMLDGSVAFTERLSDVPGKSPYTLQKINYSTEDYGNTVQLPSSGVSGSAGYTVYQGNDIYDVFISDSEYLYGFCEEEGTIALLSWADCGVSGTPYDFAVTNDEKIIWAERNIDMSTQKEAFELVILSKTPLSEVKQKTVLTLATLSREYHFDNTVQDMVAEFNKRNPNYRIEIIDYAKYNTENDKNAGLNRLTIDLTTGNIPDIMDVSNVPFTEYAKMGLFTDMYPLIAADADFELSDFVQDVFHAAESDGALYRIFPSFTVNTIIGNPHVLGPNMGWNLEEFISAVDEHPEADLTFGQWSKLSFLEEVISCSINDYINLDTGDVSFDTTEFINLLEFINTFPDDYDWGNVTYPEELTLSGRQVFRSMRLDGFQFLSWDKAFFDGEIVFKGYPATNRNGHYLTVSQSLAISEVSEHKEGAWEFVRTMLSREWQRANVFGFPTNQELFDEMISDALKNDFSHVMTDSKVTPVPLTQEDVDDVIVLINSASGIIDGGTDTVMWNIIRQCASDYFNGVRSAENTARDIQIRVSRHVSERS